MVEIKKITIDDNYAAQLIELSREWKEEEISNGMLVNERSDLKEPCIVALEEGQIVGYIFGHIYIGEKQKINVIKDGSTCFEIDELYIKKGYRSLGLGKKLFKAMEEEVKDKAEYITLPTSTKDYKRILKFYCEDVDMSFHSAYLYKKI